MHTLEEIYQKLNDIATPRTLSPDTTVVQEGYYEATDLADVDGDLAAENIVSNVTIFGITGTANTNGGGGLTYPAPVPKTGQTVSYGTQDDGALEKGVPSPVPRFTNNGNGTVTDNLTGLVWLKNADYYSVRTWASALSSARSLAHGTAGLTDGSSAGDWRMPNLREQQSLMDYGQYNPALPTGHPFSGLWQNAYWTSTTRPDSSSHAWYVASYDGSVNPAAKSDYARVWPVRDPK